MRVWRRRNQIWLALDRDDRNDERVSLPAVQLESVVRDAIIEACGEEYAGVDPQLRRPQERRFGDYQVNAVMSLAKRIGSNTRELAARLVDLIGDADGLIASSEVAGPGFINITLADAALGAAATELARETSDRPAPSKQERVVVDYSAPNVAKEMHVGHLRSTIIGDALARMNEYLGHDVIRQNHVGDWGTPFGMLIEHLLDVGEDAGAEALGVGDLTAFYQQAREKFDDDPTFADRARQRVVSLQAGDEQTLRLWRLLYDSSRRYFMTVYERLDVRLTVDDIAPESSYNDQLEDVVDELERLGLLETSDGARCAFPDDFSNRDGSPLPLIVQKDDGGFGYQATDLAAIRHRARTLHAQRLLYVVGAPQAQHLEMVFAVAQQAGWLHDVSAEHVPFGSVLGQDGRMLKTRAGASVKLIDLLAEAVRRARAIVEEKNPTLPTEVKDRLGNQIGIGAVKYADLSSDRIKDYTFAWDRMLALDGNTAPYLQYAHARICSIFRRAVERPDLDTARVEISHPAEREVVLQLVEFHPTVVASVESNQPHRLCTYLFELAQIFSRFYEDCPVLAAATPDEMESRLVLCDLLAGVLSTGLGLLGIAAPQEM